MCYPITVKLLTGGLAFVTLHIYSAPFLIKLVGKALFLVNSVIADVPTAIMLFVKAALTVDFKTSDGSYGSFFTEFAVCILGINMLFKAIPHKDCVRIAQSDFSSDCAKKPQAYSRMSRIFSAR